MTNEEIVKWLRSNMVETGSLLCLGCGHEHNCGIHGCALLREISRKGEIPVITKPASVREMSAECREIFSLGAAAHDLYVLGFCAREEKKGGKEWRTSPKIVQE